MPLPNKFHHFFSGGPVKFCILLKCWIREVWQLMESVSSLKIRQSQCFTPWCYDSMRTLWALFFPLGLKANMYSSFSEWAFNESQGWSVESLCKFIMRFYFVWEIRNRRRLKIDHVAMSFVIWKVKSALFIVPTCQNWSDSSVLGQAPYLAVQNLQCFGLYKWKMEEAPWTMF